MPPADAEHFAVPPPPELAGLDELGEGLADGLGDGLPDGLADGLPDGLGVPDECRVAPLVAACRLR
jgi:hypothetical protein